MAYHSVPLPEQFDFGSKGGPTFDVDVFENAMSGAEQRNLYHANGRRKYAPIKDVITRAQTYELLTFHQCRYGKTYSFPFKDPDDYATTGDGLNTGSWVKQLLGTGDTAEDEFQCVKHYTDGTYTYTRTITKPMNNANFKVYLNDVLQPSGYTVDYDTGIITFTSPPGMGVTVKAQFEFYVPVRFNLQDFQPERAGPNHFNIGALELIEVIGEELAA